MLYFISKPNRTGDGILRLAQPQLCNCLGVHHISAGAPEEVPLGCRLENYSGSYVSQLDRAEMGCS